MKGKVLQGKEMTIQLPACLIIGISKKTFKLIAIDLSKYALNADPKAIQQINVITNLEHAGDGTMFLIVKEV